MKTRLLFVIFLLTALGASARQKKAAAQSFDAARQLNYCNAQIHRALDLLRRADNTYDFNMEPRNILSSDRQKGWNCRTATAQEWCGGFWPGILWMDYSVSKDTAVLRAAEGYTEALRHIAYEPIFDHDIGFLMFCSFGKGYDALTSAGTASADNERFDTQAAHYKKVILASADSLATLFNPMVGTILSWPRNVRMFGGHNTIMDNMMNLDMMFWASRHGGNPLLYDLAVAHARTTMLHHFRPDGSCYHVAVYDSLDGHFIKGVTHQGYADSSMWARGQSWAIYGYTMVYRYTHNPVFLQFAQKVTDVYLRRLGCRQAEDGSLAVTGSLIPNWDFDDPDTRASKDASAACVVADALLELSRYVGKDKGPYYKDAAMKMLAELSTPDYLSGKRNVSFLLHSTGHHPAGSEIDASIIYADYYYLEALIRAKESGA